MKVVNSAKGTKKERDIVFSIFFSFLSSLAGMNMTTTSTMASVEIFEQFGIAALNALQNAPNKEELRCSIFRSFPEKTWPSGFIEYVTSMHAMDPSPSWCAEKIISLYSGERQRLVFLGYKVRSAFDQTRRTINNQLNPIWNALPKTIPSGVSKSSLLLWVRKKHWPKQAYDAAVLAVRQRHTRECRGTKYVAKDHTAEIEETASRKEFKDHWFPNSWLSFVFLGLPSAI
jgi:hypothetical protein